MILSMLCLHFSVSFTWSRSSAVCCTVAPSYSIGYSGMHFNSVQEKVLLWLHHHRTVNFKVVRPYTCTVRGTVLALGIDKMSNQKYFCEFHTKVPSATCILTILVSNEYLIVCRCGSVCYRFRSDHFSFAMSPHTLLCTALRLSYFVHSLSLQGWARLSPKFLITLWRNFLSGLNIFNSIPVQGVAPYDQNFLTKPCRAFPSVSHNSVQAAAFSQQNLSN